jgi:hypothetical protein
MSGGKVTHYDVLGVSRDARREEIVRAYRERVQELQQESTMPDAIREAKLHEAYEVLSDSHRRSFYDASLRKKPLFSGASTRARQPRWIAGLGAGLVALVAALYFSLRPPPGPPALPASEVMAAISRSVGQVQAIEMSGRTSAVGMAFAVDSASMVTACPVVPPGAQLLVRLGPRTAPAQVAVADEQLGVCKLAVAGVGSWPLTVTTLEPRVGETIYVARMAANGEVTLAEGKLKGFVSGARGKVMELSIPIGPAEAGSPILDTQARVVGIAAPPQGAWPARWVNEARARRREP